MRKLKPVTPGELLLEEFLMPMGISQYRLAKEIGVPAQRIGEVVAGRRAITADTDLRLCRFFGLSNGYWQKEKKRKEKGSGPFKEKKRGQAPFAEQGKRRKTRKGVRPLFPFLFPLLAYARQAGLFQRRQPLQLRNKEKGSGPFCRAGEKKTEKRGQAPFPSFSACPASWSIPTSAAASASGSDAPRAGIARPGAGRLPRRFAQFGDVAHGSARAAVGRFPSA